MAVVKWLACFYTPSEVVGLVKANFDIKTTPQAVEAYDPTKVAGEKLSEGLKKIFEETRKKYIEDSINIDVAHQVFRLTQLSMLYRKALAAGNIILAGLFLKQCAEEVGGMFTNRRELTGKDGGPLLVPLSPEITEALMAGYNEVMKGGAGGGDGSGES